MAVTLYFAGGQVEIAGTSIVAFAVWCLVLVALPVYFNRSVNHEDEYIDERWGYGSIDDDEWGTSTAAVRPAVNRRLAELVGASEARRQAEESRRTR